MKSNSYFAWNKELSHEICQKLINLGQGNWNRAAVVNKSVVGARKSDIVWTFLPLIHLSSKHKIKLEQEKEFGEIYVKRESGN